MGRLIAFCGIDCADCTAYLATQADDRAALERVAALWREAFDTAEIGVAEITCDGCPTSAGRLSGFCSRCRIRQCGVERGIANCGHCPDYPCEQLTDFFQRMDRFFEAHEGFVVRPQRARAVLDEIHGGLQGGMPSA